jgi:hypothetical protein
MEKETAPFTVRTLWSQTSKSKKSHKNKKANLESLSLTHTVECKTVNSFVMQSPVMLPVEQH